MRQLAQETPAVAESFSLLRRAEDAEAFTMQRIAVEDRERKRDVAEALSDKNAAVARLRETRRTIQELEGMAASRHALKTFTLRARGGGRASSRNNRCEVLDRLARIRAGLSPGQKNDCPWFKEAWDNRMFDQHGASWGSRFAAWMQNILDDESANTFSTFVYKETCRVFNGTAALHVPGA